MASKIFNKIQKAFGDIKIKSIESFIADGELYITATFLSTYWGVTTRQITSYVKDGLAKSDKSIAGAGGVALFNLSEAIEWRNSTIRLDKAKSTEKGKQKAVEIPKSIDSPSLSQGDVFEDEGIRPYNDSDAMEKHYKANLAQAKYEEQIGNLVSIDEADRAGAEQAMIHKSWINQLEAILPTLVEKKTSGECRDIIIRHNQEYKDQLEKMANKIVKGHPSLWEAVNVIREEFASGATMIKIIDRLRVK